MFYLTSTLKLQSYEPWRIPASGKIKFSSLVIEGDMEEENLEKYATSFTFYCNVGRVEHACK